LAILGCNRIGSAPAGERWWTPGTCVITSGTLLNLEAARLIGRFRDDFFIDCVDFEFCLRARFMGFAIVEILAPIMDHSIGTPQPIRFLWVGGRTSNHRPWRWYYIVRNNVSLVGQYIWKDPAWAGRTVLSRMRDITLALMFENARLLKLRHMALGLYDGLRGRFDRVPVGRR
jgi:rhamnosyltransferase